MPIDFHAEKNRFRYTTREAEPQWIDTIRKITPIQRKKVLDLGCGGGIYSKALANMGAAEITAYTRTGRSILHELTDEELQSLVTYIQSQFPRETMITEKDRWTI